VNEGDVSYLAVTVSIDTNEWHDADMIRDMVLEFYAGLPAMQSSAPWISNVNPEAAIQDINLTMHPGAQAALEQLGVTIPEMARG
jgi:TRAP-type uncharacterized transport system substrate-binding protein